MIEVQNRIRWWVPKLGAEEKRYLDRVVENSFPNEGELSTEFEGKIAALTGAKHAVAVTSGTTAIFLALKAAGVGHGDEVVVPDITFIATANAVEMCGATPVLADIDAKSMCISPDAFRKAVTEKTKAVIPVHVSGRAADMKHVKEIAESKGIRVIEDAAEAFMSKHKGRCLGTIGDLGCLSFSPHKIITTGQGGIVLTSDDKLHTRLRELKDHGRRVRGTGGDDIHNAIGYNFKFTDLQAAVGLGQLSYLEQRMKRIRERHKAYSENLVDVAGLRLFDFDAKGGELPLWTDAEVEDRDELDRHLSAKGIDCRRYWFPIHKQKPYESSDKGLEESTAMSSRALWLPSAYTLSDQDIQRVCSEIKNFMKTKKR